MPLLDDQGMGMRLMERREQIRARRRIVLLVGFAGLVVATATACIFDKNDYQGGGRIDHGGEAKTAEPTSEPTTQPTSTAPDDGAVADPGDAGGG